MPHQADWLDITSAFPEREDKRKGGTLTKHETESIIGRAIVFVED